MLIISVPLDRLHLRGSRFKAGKHGGGLATSGLCLPPRFGADIPGGLVAIEAIALA